MSRASLLLCIIIVCFAGIPVTLMSQHDILSEPVSVTLIEDLDTAVAPPGVAQAPFHGDTVAYPVVPEIEIVEDAAVDQMVFCVAIKDRTPVTVADTFPSDISAVYCYTRIVGVEDTTEVIHSWYHGETKVADVKLAVKSPLWRTWSRKKIIPSQHGEWKVEVIAPNDSVIASERFFIE